jgi:integrase
MHGTQLVFQKFKNRTLPLNWASVTGAPSSGASFQLPVDINTIRAWLGHISLNTTNVYAEVDLEMKAKALATCEIRGAVPPKHWKHDVALMEFLRSL